MVQEQGSLREGERDRDGGGGLKGTAALLRFTSIKKRQQDEGHVIHFQ